jgi:hypothetical protein
LHRRHAATERVARQRTFSVSLTLVGLVAVLVSAWGALVPFLGPAIGFGADGSGSWHWNLAHSLLGLVPGAVGIVIGLSMMAPRGVSVARSRLNLSWDALLAVAAGAWFVVGPLAWNVAYGRFFVSASPTRTMEYWVGYALGPGLLLAVCGAFALGWAARHDRPLKEATTASADGAAEPAPSIAGPLPPTVAAAP